MCTKFESVRSLSQTYLFSHTTMNSVNSHHVYTLKGCHSARKLDLFAICEYRSII